MSEKKEIIRHIDKNQITAVKFKFPALMSDKAEEMIRQYYQTFLDAQNALYDARNEVRKCEAEFEKAKEQWHKVQTLAEIEFLTKEKEVEVSKPNTMVFKGVGNSTLGYDTRIK